MTATSYFMVVAIGLVAIVSRETRAAPDVGRKLLPAPRRDGGPALESVLAKRKSTRVFGIRDLDDAELGQLLWAAQGVTDGHRTSPSAGALYPLTLRVADAKGIWRYVPEDHAVVRESPEDRRTVIAAASFGQDAVRGAPVILVMTANVAITARKYGDRAERYVMLEAGHVAQNLLLEATALGLGAVPVGAFDDGAVRSAVGLPDADTPLYLIPIGASP